MNLAAKYEQAHFGVGYGKPRERSERQQRHLRGSKAHQHHEASASSGRSTKSRSLQAREQGRREEGRSCMLLLPEAWTPQEGQPLLQEGPGKRLATSVEEGPAVARVSKDDLTLNTFKLDLLCDDPLVYRSSSLFKMQGEIQGEDSRTSATILLDPGATTVYVSRSYVTKRGLPTQRFPDKTITVQIGDNKMTRATLKVVEVAVHLPGGTGVSVLKPLGIHTRRERFCRGDRGRQPWLRQCSHSV